MAEIIYYGVIGTFIAVPVLMILFLIGARFADSWTQFERGSEREYEGAGGRWMAGILISALLICLAKVAARSLAN